jgi:hypothetical protein
MITNNEDESSRCLLHDLPKALYFLANRSGILVCGLQPGTNSLATPWNPHRAPPGAWQVQAPAFDRISFNKSKIAWSDLQGILSRNSRWWVLEFVEDFACSAIGLKSYNPFYLRRTITADIAVSEIAGESAAWSTASGASSRAVRGTRCLKFMPGLLGLVKREPLQVTWQPFRRTLHASVCRRYFDRSF